MKHQMTQQGVTQNPALNALLARGYKLTPATLAAKITKGRWIAVKHLLYMSTKITAAVNKGGARIIVTVPARHGKSEFISIHTPIWYFDKFPDKNIILTSYGADLATDFSRRVRDTLAEEPPELDVRLSPDSQQVNRFHTTMGGAMFAVGVGGAITGRGAHLLLVDDYIKNAEDSLSENQRNKTWEWFTSTAYTRLEPGASVIILATRWNIDDLVGRLLDDDRSTRWDVIRLPALAEEEDVLGREVGEALWPERYTQQNLEEIRNFLGNYWWQALYQQAPLASMSNQALGDKLIPIALEELPHISRLRKVRAWDFAASEERGDFTAGPMMMRDKVDGRIFITDMEHFQKGPGATEDRVVEVAMSDGHLVPIWIEQEPGSAGKIVVANYSEKVLKDYHVKGWRPTGPLETRAALFLAQVEKNNVYIVKGSWNKMLRDEVNAFPLGAHDDQIAALALACERLMQGTMQSVVWGNFTRDAIKSRENPNEISRIATKSEPRIIKGVTW